MAPKDQSVGVEQVINRRSEREIDGLMYDNLE